MDGVEAMSQSRKYDVILLGATGYTGTLTAQYISKHYQTTIKWAIAGRNKSKLADLATSLQRCEETVSLPSIEVVNFDITSLRGLAMSSKVLISTVEPYQKHGSLPFQACAENGTHYVDCTGETPWFTDMVQRYHDAARKSGAIMIPMCGFDCVPSDLSTWFVVDRMRKENGCATGRVDVAIFDLKGGVSGGTLASFMTALDSHPIGELKRIFSPFLLSPRSPTGVRSRKRSFAAKYLGLNRVEGLGWMAYTPQGPIDRAYVHRSWGLHSPTPEATGAWGENFEFHAWARMLGPLRAVLYHWAFMAVVGLFMLKPVRRLVQQLYHQPGSGPDVEGLKKNYLEYRCMAQPDECVGEKGDRDPTLEISSVKERMRYDGDPYLFTAMTLGEGALSLLEDQTEAHRFGGGVLTSAMLGAPFADRLRGRGLILEVLEGQQNISM